MTALALGPMNHYWYRWLDVLLPGAGLRFVLAKTGLDLASCPAFSGTFVVGTGLQEGASLGEALTEYRGKFTSIVSVDVMVPAPPLLLVRDAGGGAGVAADAVHQLLLPPCLPTGPLHLRCPGKPCLGDQRSGGSLLGYEVFYNAVLCAIKHEDPENEEEEELGGFLTDPLPALLPEPPTLALRLPSAAAARHHKRRKAIIDALKIHRVG